MQDNIYSIKKNSQIYENALNLLKASLLGDSSIQNPGLITDITLGQKEFNRKITFNLGKEINQNIIK